MPRFLAQVRSLDLGLFNCNQTGPVQCLTSVRQKSAGNFFHDEVVCEDLVLRA
jgi:hypothetical protein